MGLASVTPTPQQGKTLKDILPKMIPGKGNNLTHGAIFEFWRLHVFNQQAFMAYLLWTHATKHGHFYDRKLRFRVLLIKMERPSISI